MRGSIRSRLNSILNASFVRNVGLLASGTILGQAIMVFVLPLLTRLYSPEAFGALGIFMSVTAVLSVAACLRLDLAIPLPDEDEDALNLLVLGIVSATVIAALTGAVLMFRGEWLSRAIEHDDLNEYLYLVPIAVWLGAAYSAIQFWSLRKKRFGQVAATQLTRAIGGSGTQVALGATGFTSLGLVVGHVAYTALGTAGLVYHFLRFDRALLRAVSLKSLRRVLSDNRRFPMFSVPESILDSAANNLPVVMIASLAGPKEAGFMLLAMRVTSIPVGLLGGSLSRVFLSEAADRRRKRDLGAFTRIIMKRLLQIGLIPFLLLGFAAPYLFPLVFGAEWQRAGTMVSWMVPYMLLQFIVSPVSTSLHATGNQVAAFLLQLVGFVLLFGSIAIASSIAISHVFEWFALASLFYYAIYISVVLWVSRNESEQCAD